MKRMFSRILRRIVFKSRRISLCLLLVVVILFIGKEIVKTLLWEYRLAGNSILINLSRLGWTVNNTSRNYSTQQWSNVMYPKKPITSLIDMKQEFYSVKSTNITLKQDRITVLYYNEWLDINRSDFTTNDGVCSYSNCYFTHRTTLFNNSSAVIFKLRGDFDFTPPDKKQGQIWIFKTMESPMHNGGWIWRNWNWRDKMNWTLNYRLDSDILATYGFLQTSSQSTVRSYQGLFQNKTGLVAWIVSNCETSSGRDKYVAELQQYIPVDIYGLCGKPLVNDRRETIENYKFYLAFENSLCLDYVSEKFFNYYQYDILLVTRGGAEYDRILPRDTFINTARYSSVKELSEFLLFLSKNETAYLTYLKNRDKYNITSLEQGHNFYSCKLCEKLNNPDKYRNVYSDLVNIWDRGQCWFPNDYTDFGWNKKVLIIMFMFCVVFVLIGLNVRNQWCWFKKRSLSLRFI